MILREKRKNERNMNKMNKSVRTKTKERVKEKQTKGKM